MKKIQDIISILVVCVPLIAILALVKSPSSDAKSVELYNSDYTEVITYNSNDDNSIFIDDGKSVTIVNNETDKEVTYGWSHVISIQLN